MNKFKVLIGLVCSLFIASHSLGNEGNFSFKVDKSGNGSRAVILIPGFASSGEVWKETADFLGENFICYTLTMPGFAGVEPEENPSFEGWKNSIADFIKDKNLQNPILIGHSMGGGLALAVAADFPDLVGKIVIVDAVPALQALSNPNFNENNPADCAPIINQFLSLNDENFYQMQKMSVPGLSTDSTKHEMMINWSIQSDRSTFATIYCDFWNTDLREKIKNIQCPSLILLEAPFIHINAQIEEQYKHLKTSNIQYANQGLHFIMYDDKDWYFSQINNFLGNE